MSSAENDPMNVTPGSKVTIFFNVGLTVALGYFAFLGFLFRSADKVVTVRNISRLPLVQDHIALEFAVGCLAMITGVLLLIHVVKELWNRIVTRLIGVREMTYTEAYALVLFVLCLAA
jgi:hypothetical protein